MSTLVAIIRVAHILMLVVAWLCAGCAAAEMAFMLVLWTLTPLLSMLGFLVVSVVMLFAREVSRQMTGVR